MIEGSVQPLARVMNPFDVKSRVSGLPGSPALTKRGLSGWPSSLHPGETTKPFVAGRFADVAAVLIAAREDYGIAPPGFFGGGARCTVR